MTSAVVFNATEPTPAPVVVVTTATTREFTPASIGTLVGLLFFMAILLVWVVVRVVQEGIHLELLRLLRFRRRSPKATKERIVRRYETVEHWLITKRIQPHDGFCQRVCCEIVPQSPTDDPDDVEAAVTALREQERREQRDNNNNATVDDIETGTSTTAAAAESTAAQTSSDGSSQKACACHASSENPSCSLEKKLDAQPSQLTVFTDNDDDDDSLFDDNHKECPICMNVFQIDDIVSWSANTQCNHVYHHECIKEWLLRRTGCPFCRQTFLPCDDHKGHKADTEALKLMSKRFASRSSTSYYCIQEGLLQLPPMVRCTLRELETLKTRIFQSALAPSELVSLRGQRQDGTAVGGDDDDIMMGEIEEASETTPERATDNVMVCFTPNQVPRIRLAEEVDQEDEEEAVKDDDDNSPLTTTPTTTDSSSSDSASEGTSEHA